MRFHPAGYGLALLTAAVILPFQIPRILDHRAWAAGTDHTMGMIDKVIISRRVTEVRYSYEVNGRRYTGSDTGQVFLEGTPERVTYAKSNPAVSTLMPESMDGMFVVSWIFAVIGVVPLAILLWLELQTWMRKRRASAS